MKNLRQTTQIFAALILSSILYVGSSITLIKTASADSIAPSARRALESSNSFIALVPNPVDEKLAEQARSSASQLREEIAAEPPRNRSLPNSVAQAVLQAAAKLSNLPSEQLRIVQAKQKDWPDGCLGLAEPETFCTQIVVSGWEVKVAASGRGTYVYRTNNSGSLVKLDNRK